MRGTNQEDIMTKTFALLQAAKEEAVEMNRLRIDSTDKHFVIVAGDDQ